MAAIKAYLYSSLTTSIRGMENLSPKIFTSHQRIYVDNEIRNSNIYVAKKIKELLGTSFGPKGSHKLYVSKSGKMILTKQGFKILNILPLNHPVAKIFADIAEAQFEECGDGTISAVILSAELLDISSRLLEKGLSPRILLEGFKEAGLKALELYENISTPVQLEDVNSLMDIVKTSIASKVQPEEVTVLADLIVKVWLMVNKFEECNFSPQDCIKISKIKGGSLRESKVINGLVMHTQIAHPDMPKIIKNAKIALIDQGLSVRKTKLSAKVEVNSFRGLAEIVQCEREIMRSIARKLVEVGANVVFCRRGIHDAVLHYLSRAGIITTKRVNMSDFEKLSKVTGAKIVNCVEELRKSDLGFARYVKEEKIQGDKIVIVEGCGQPGSTTILLRGVSEKLLEEVERTIISALKSIKVLVHESKVVAGGGASEIKVSLALKEYAKSIPGKRQVAVEAFAEALEIIPKLLAKNLDLDPIETLAKLKYLHLHGEHYAGLDALNGEITNTFERGILEPLYCKKQMIKSAVEAVLLLLKTDQLIIVTRPEGIKRTKDVLQRFKKIASE